MTQALHWALEYRALTLVLIGLVLAALALLTSDRAPHELRLAQVVLRWFLLCSIGAGFVWVGAQQMLPLAAANPLRFQLGLAALGFAVLGFASAWGGLGMRLAALVGPSVWIVGGLLGKAAGLGGTGPDGPFGLRDVLVPLVGFALLAWQFRAQRHRSVFARSRL
ncbi:MAG: MFS transporter permease [Thiomonas sp. 20-64-9]|nr:MAG: MFS transporter permease [Thiomonas sp. 20-64-9]